MAEISTKPYMIRAIHEWCSDNGYTPYMLVKVGGRARVPMQHVQNGEIVLNTSLMATNALHMDNDFIRFEARFNGVPEHIIVPVGNVAAIYARETGSGMAFEPELDEDESVPDTEAPARGPALSAVPPPETGESGTSGSVLAFGRKGQKGRGQGDADAAAGSRSAGASGASAGAQKGSRSGGPAAVPGRSVAAGPAQSGPPGDEPPPSGGGKPRLVRVK